MTTAIVTASTNQKIADVLADLRQLGERRSDIDGVVVIDDDGRIVDDVSLLEIAVAQPISTIGSIAAAPWAVAVDVDAPIVEVIEKFVDARGSSIVVIDKDQRPVGRILGDDVVDILLGERSRIRFGRRT
jgi:Mg/Co/Ni transporter MgtE